MEIAAYVLIGFATVLGIITGAIYAEHRIPAIVIFGVAFLLTDVSICLFWAAKTPPEDKQAMSGTIVPKPNMKPKLLFSSESSTATLLEIGDSGSVFQWLGKAGSPIFLIGEDTLTVERLAAGTIALTTVIRDPTGKIIAEIVQNNWRLRPSLLWDRNFNGDAVEVRDESGEVVLQARALPDRIRLQGRWYGKNGGFLQLVKSPDPTKPGGFLVQRPQSQLRIAPMFRYPSDQHFGELISN